MPFGQDKMNNETLKQKSIFPPPLQPDHQNYGSMSRSIAVGPFCLSHFQTHITSMGCFMYPGEKLCSANACFQMYIWATPSWQDAGLKSFSIRSVKGGKRMSAGGAKSHWFHHTPPFVSSLSKQEVSCQQLERRDLCSPQRATYFALLRDLVDSSGAYLCYIFEGLHFFT